MSDAKQDFLSTVAALPKFGTGVCLERINASLQQLDLVDYIANCRKIAVTGTNGKGSTAHMLNSIVHEFGFKVGLFSSPHFVDFNDRFKVSKTNVDYSALNIARQSVMNVVSAVSTELDEQFGVFEVLFLIALKTFQAQQCDFLIFEAGIGGRYDPVRMLNAEHTVLTSVDLEHCDILGNSKDVIAFDKLDACYHGGTVALGNLSSELKRKITAYASSRAIRCLDNELVTEATPASNASVKQLALRLPCGNAIVTVTTPIVDFFAQANMKTALTLCEALFAGPEFGFSTEQRVAVYTSALSTYENPGRLSYLSRSPDIIVDSAHTNDAFEMLFKALRQELGEQKPIFLVGISAGREQATLVQQLTEFAAECIVTCASFKGAEPQLLHNALINNGVVSTVANNIASGLAMAIERAEQEQRSVVICGGLFFAAEATAILQQRSTQALFLY